MDILLSIAEDLALRVLIDWLDVKQLVLLDSAYTSTHSRPAYLTLSSGVNAVYNHNRFTRYQSELKSAYVRWFAGKNMHLSAVELILGGTENKLFLVRCGINLREVVFTCKWNYGRREMYMSALDMLQTHCPNLRTLVFEKFDSGGCMCGDQYDGYANYINNLISPLPLLKLVELDMSCDASVPIPLLNNLLRLCPLLGRLRVDELNCSVYPSALLPIYQLCPQLKDLSIYCRNFNDALVLDLVKGGERLKALTLMGRGTSTLRRSTLHAVGASCPHLISLELEDLNLTDSSVELILQYYPGLKKLNVSENAALTDRALRTITRLCPNLLALHVVDCPRLTDTGFAAFYVGGFSVELHRFVSDKRFTCCVNGYRKYDD